MANCVAIFMVSFFVGLSVWTVSSAPAPTAVVVQQPASSSPDNSLAGIRDQFVGGVSQIAGSGGALAGLAVGTVEHGVQNAANAVGRGVMAVAQPVVNVAKAVVQPVVNGVKHVEAFAGNVRQAGHEIVGTWGDSFRQSKNITSHLFDIS